MAHQWGRVCCNLGLAGTLTIGAVLTASDRASAQLTPDNTLGAEGSQVVPGTLQGIPIEQIEGGAQRGANLFHSFLQLNVAPNQQVYFANPVGVQNILTRVTGGQASQILGRLGVLGSANLFLLNPSGIVFGPGASLDVQGSFIASTADAIPLGNQGVFSATQPGNSTLLNVQPDTFFLTALANQRAGITNQANLTAAQDLMLAGSSIISSGQLQAGGRVYVRADAGDASLTSVTGQNVDLIARNLTVQTVNAQSDAQLTANQNLTVTNVTSSTATLRAAQSLNLNSSQLSTTGDLTLQGGQVLATDSVTTPLNIQSGATLQITGGASGINFQALNNPASAIGSGGSLILTSGGNITTNARFSSAASLSFTAAGSLLSDGGQFNAGGNLDLFGSTVLLQDNANNPFVASAGGTLQIRSIQGTDILASNNPASQFNSGADLLFTSNGAITAEEGRFTSGRNVSFAAGQNSSVPSNRDLELTRSTITATGNVSLSSTGQTNVTGSSTSPFSAIAGGSLTVSGNTGVNLSFNDSDILLRSTGAMNLTSTNGSVIARGTFQPGGNFGINAGTDITLPSFIGTSLVLSSNGNINVGSIDTSSSTGNGGLVDLRSLTGNITAISINTSSVNGTGGNVNLNARGTVDVGEVNASSQAGNAGNVTFTAGLNILTRGPIDASSQNGRGGRIVFTSGGSVDTTAGALNASSIAGYGGSVDIQGSQGIRTATIDTSSFNTNGGIINLTSDRGDIDTSRGDVLSYSIWGNGGNVTFEANGNLRTATIDASTGTDTQATPGTRGGNITLTSRTGAIDTRTNNPNGGIFSYSYQGDGGAVVLNAFSDINTSLIDSSSEDGNGGNISLLSQVGGVNATGGDLRSYTYVGNGGNITVSAKNNILTGTILAFSDDANGGNVSLTSSTGSIDTTGGSIESYVRTVAGGRGGEVNLNAAQNLKVGDIRSDGGTDKSGNITVVSDRNGNIDITGRTLNSSNYGSQTGGNIVIQTGATGKVSINQSNILSAVESGATGAGGNVYINGGSILLNNAKLDTSTFGSGSGGSIFVTALNNGAVTIANGSNISTTVKNGATGAGGGIAISGGQVSLTNLATIASGTEGIGNSGNIDIIGQAIVLNTSFIKNDTSGNASGSGGNINLTAPLISLTGSRVSAEVRDSSSGKGGNVFVNTGNGSLNLSRNSLISTAVDSVNASGDGGDINVLSRSVSVLEGSQLIARTRGSGNAGNIQVSTSGDIDIFGSFTIGTNTFYSGLLTSSEKTSSGRGGNITINSQGTLRVGDSGFLGAGTKSELGADGGNIEVNVNRLEVTGGGQLITSASDPNAGNAGNIAVNATQGVFISGSNPKFILNEGLNPNESQFSGLFAQSKGFGSAGNLIISAPQMLVQDFAKISVETQLSGAGGRLDIFTGQLRVQSGAEISASTSGVGDGGVLTVKASKSVVLDSGAILAARSTGSGNAGDLKISAPLFRIEDGAQATVSSTDTGNAGNLTVDARVVSLGNGGRLAAETNSGSGGNITLSNLDVLDLNNRSQITASTRTGQGGTLSVNASRSITLDNQSGLFASATDKNGAGTAGNLLLSTNQLGVYNGSEISTSTAGQGNAGRILAQANSFYLMSGSRITSRSEGAGNAGSITVQVSGKLRLNRGEISASSEKGGGGNINISARDIEFKNSSLISTQVSSGSGEGGNISITARDIFIALEDSDILANAEDGNGGRIEIRSPVFIADLFANVGQNPGRDFSRFRGNGQVDISASSRFGVSGVVSIPDFSFLQDSLDSLSETFVAPEQVVAGSCLARRNVEQGSFVVAGTGGLPEDPYNLVKSRYRVVRVRPIGNSTNRTNQRINTNPSPSAQSASKAWKLGDPIQEAQGFMQTADGRIVLGTDAQLATIAKADEIICAEDTPEVSANHL